jgi:uncharacterized membrane protein
VSEPPPGPGVRRDADGTPLRRAAPRRLTSATLSLGVAVSAACFIVAAVAEVLGISRRDAAMTDLDALLEGAQALDPWALASLGTYAVILTPAAALLATAWEYATISDRRTVLLALAVLTVLGASVLVAVLG